MRKLFALTLLALTLGVTFGISSNAEALSGSEFQAGRIIDDGVFFNGQGMDANGVQGFLNSKVPNCDTWGNTPYSTNQTRAQYGASRGNPAPYTCLKDYRQDTPTKGAEYGLCGQYNGGNKSAAQIISDVSAACGINPKVLIVLLQKEQSLITDDWPWNIQYRSATGYGCPDTAPCDAEYYGFFNQTYNAARQFKKYNRDQTSFRYRAGRDNYIQYNPNAGCGGTNVYIQNQATAGLYNYTPYQPNPSALANLYGSGDNCGAYGNRNFWRMYNDWFGSTRFSYGPVPSHQSLYARSACTVPWFDSGWVGRLYQPDVKNYLYTTSYGEACQAVSYGYIWDDVVMKNATESDKIPVYRLANYERNVFTTDVNVRNNAINSYGYRDEGIGFYVYPSGGANRTPVTGLQSGDTFFVTSAGKEAEYYNTNYGYYVYGTVFYTPIFDTSKSTIYRFARNNQRIYTPHQNEIDSARYYGYQPEGSVASNDIKPNTGNLPVYRVRNSNGIYLYTMSRDERDRAILFYNATSEGTPFYSLLWSNTPVLRANNPYNGFWIFASNQQEYNNAVHNHGYNGDGAGWYSY